MTKWRTRTIAVKGTEWDLLWRALVKDRDQTGFQKYKAQQQFTWNAKNRHANAMIMQRNKIELYDISQTRRTTERSSNSVILSYNHAFTQLHSYQTLQTKTSSNHLTPTVTRHFHMNASLLRDIQHHFQQTRHFSAAGACPVHGGSRQKIWRRSFVTLGSGVRSGRRWRLLVDWAHRGINHVAPSLRFPVVSTIVGRMPVWVRALDSCW